MPCSGDPSSTPGPATAGGSATAGGPGDRGGSGRVSRASARSSPGASSKYTISRPSASRVLAFQIDCALTGVIGYPVLDWPDTRRRRSAPREQPDGHGVSKVVLDIIVVLVIVCIGGFFSA